jgi:hypothetical protein
VRIFSAGSLSLVGAMPAARIRQKPPPVRPAPSTNAIFARFDQDRPATLPQHPLIRPELQEEDSDSDAAHGQDTDASDYEEAAEESTCGDSASDCTGSATGDPDDRADDDDDVYNCEFFEIPCTTPRLSLFRNRNNYQRPHMPCPLLVEEDYLKE